MKFDNVLANELLMSGYTLPEVAKKLKLNYQQVVYNYKPIPNKNKYIEEEEEEEVKEEKIYFNETYCLESLSPNDLEAYDYYENKNKAYYEI